MQLGPIGIWSGPLRRGDPGEVAEAAAELDQLGYAAVWIPGGAGGDVLGDAGRLLQATRHMVVATGILNVWMHDPDDVAAGHAALTGEHPGRFLLGLGVSHAPSVGGSGQVYERPLAKIESYLDALDAADPPVPSGERALAALGPRMLALARDRTAGAHPYLVGPEHTALARQVLGAGPLLAPEQKVVLETDPAAARAIAPPAPGPLPRAPELHQQPVAHRLPGGRPRRRWQRPAGGRHRGVGRHVGHRRPGPRPSRRRGRPRVPAGAARRPRCARPGGVANARRGAPAGLRPGARSVGALSRARAGPGGRRRQGARRRGRARPCPPWPRPGRAATSLPPGGGAGSAPR